MSPDKRSMTPLTLSAYTLVTANGRGIGAVSRSLRDRRTGLRPCNFEDALLKTYRPGGWSRGLLAWKRIGAVRLPEQPAGMARSATRRIHGGGGRSQTTVRLRSHCRRHGNQHVRNSRNGTCLCATGSPTDRLGDDFTARYRYTHNMFSSGHFVRACLGLHGPALVISTACSSSAKVFATAARYLQAGLCDAAIVGVWTASV